MIRSRGLAVTAAALALPVAAGCGFGEGESNEGEAELRVTRDYGTEVLLEATVADPSESETVMRAVDAEADVATRYGGRFVQSIDGVEGTVEDGRSFDWFFYVDGIESSVGAADVAVEPGARIWWDYRDWTDVMRVPAVVGSFPEPLAQTSAENPEAVRLECAGAEAACAEAGERLAEAGIDFTNERFDPGGGTGAMRVLVGEWEDVREDETAALLEEGPSISGVFADPVEVANRWAVRRFDAGGTPDDVLVTGGGLVAALRPAEDPPVWVVAGMDAEGLDATVEALDERTLRDRYAVALTPEPEPVPIMRAGTG